MTGLFSGFLALLIFTMALVIILGVSYNLLIKLMAVLAIPLQPTFSRYY